MSDRNAEAGSLTDSSASGGGGGRAPGRLPRVWGQVPQQNMNFTGRENLLARLHDGSSDDVTAVLPHALHGLGGVGKTQGLVEYAHKYMSDYDVVWWIHAEQPALVRASLAALAPHLGLPALTTTGILEASSAVLDALRRGAPSRKWLVGLD